jgi:hypothetical protein
MPGKDPQGKLFASGLSNLSAHATDQQGLITEDFWLII